MGDLLCRHGRKSFVIYTTLFLCGSVTGEFTLPEYQEYDVCTTEGDFCLPLKRCPFYDFKDLKSSNRPPMCGYNGSEPIVCCTTDTTTIFKHEHNRHSITGQMCLKYENTVCSKDGVKVEDDDEEHLRRIEYMAMLGYKSGRNITWKCSGTLISERYVLSSASCSNLQGLGSPLYARLGHGAKSLTAGITLMFVHPDYNYPTLNNDIALYRLNETVKLHDEIEPACLHEHTSILTTNHLFTRKWFSRSTSERSKPAGESIMLDLLPYEECNKVFKKILPNGFQKLGMICAGQKSRKRGDRPTCFNERGGPVTLPPTPNHYESDCFLIRQAGLWTHAFKCNSSASIGVFTNVAYHISWIESIVWPDNSTSSLQVWQ